MKKLIFIVLTVSFLVFGCGGSDDKNHPALKVINENLVATINEDFDACMATIHPESPAYESSKIILPQLFKMYDLDYKIKSMKVVEEDDQQITVKFVQETKKISGPEFRDNRIEGQHILKKDNGVWKIYFSKINKTEYLD